MVEGQVAIQIRTNAFSISSTRSQTLLWLTGKLCIEVSLSLYICYCSTSFWPGSTNGKVKASPIHLRHLHPLLYIADVKVCLLSNQSIPLYLHQKLVWLPGHSRREWKNLSYCTYKHTSTLNQPLVREENLLGNCGYWPKRGLLY